MPAQGKPLNLFATLSIVLVLALLVTYALPKFQIYHTRHLVTELYESLEPVRTAVQVIWDKQHSFHQANFDPNEFPFTQPLSPYMERISVSNGVITVDSLIYVQAKAIRLTLTPQPGNNLGLQWQCAVSDPLFIPYVPAYCRNLMPQ